MAINLTIPDLATDNTSFLDYFRSFSVTRQTDGKGGVVVQGTLSVEILDSTGQPYKTASLTKDLPPAAAASLRDFIKANYLADIKAQEGI